MHEELVVVVAVIHEHHVRWRVHGQRVADRAQRTRQAVVHDRLEPIGDRVVVEDAILPAQSVAAAEESVDRIHARHACEVKGGFKCLVTGPLAGLPNRRLRAAGQRLIQHARLHDAELRDRTLERARKVVGLRDALLAEG